MPDPRRELEEFLQQLERLPGGPAAAVPDFFGPRLAGGAELGANVFPLDEGGELRLHEDGSLVHVEAGVEHFVARPDAETWRAIRELASADMPALPLALVAITLGVVDDGRRLKRRLPKLDGAARDLMLMTVCRLCG